MQVMVSDMKKLIKKERWIEYEKDFDKKIFEVYAIINKNLYFIYYNNDFCFFNSKLMKVTDSTIPNDWKELSFSKKKKMKLWYDSFEYDCLSIKDYYGPEYFLENDFLIKAMMSKKEAYTLFNNYLKSK